MENEFSSDTVPFPFDGQPIVATPSPATTSKEEDELQSAKEELSEFSRRSSPALFEFSDDESQSLVQIYDLRKLSQIQIRGSIEEIDKSDDRKYSLHESITRQRRSQHVQRSE